MIELLFEDSSPAVPDASLAKLFDRLYRVDPSRNRTTGASGLGLSICDAIINAHGGDISAEKSSIGGLAIRFSLPLKDQRV
jgi:two-component system sensor histidine kinase BaeS